MKRFNKLIGAALLLCITLFSVRAETVVLSTTAGTNFVGSLFQGRASIASIQMYNSGGTALALTLRDAPTNQMTYTNAAWISVARTVSVVTNSVDNFNGDAEETYSLVSTTSYVTNSAAAVSYRSLGAYVVPAGGTITLTPSEFIQTSFGTAVLVGGVATNAVVITAEIYRK